MIFRTPHFLVVQLSKTFNEAKTYCEEEIGTYLGYPTSYDEAREIQRYPSQSIPDFKYEAEGFDYTKYWIDAQYSGGNHVFNPWCGLTPTSGCAYSTSDCWDVDSNCQEKKYFICQS